MAHFPTVQDLSIKKDSFVQDGWLLRMASTGICHSAGIQKLEFHLETLKAPVCWVLKSLSIVLLSGCGEELEPPFHWPINKLVI